MMGANPTPIAWSETASAIRQRVADALDRNVMGLNLFGFKEIVSYCTLICAVQDGGDYSCNLKWFNSLDTQTKEGLLWGSQITFLQNMLQVTASREFAFAEMAAAGVKFYSPTAEELAQWSATAGEQRKEWDSLTVELIGSIAAFNRLKEAAKTQRKYYVSDA